MRHSSRICRPALPLSSRPPPTLCHPRAPPLPTQVYDIYLAKHLEQPEKYMRNNEIPPLGRVCANVDVSVDFCRDHAKPTSKRSLTVSLMD